MTGILIIIAVICVLFAYTIGRAVGYSNGFSDAYRMLDNITNKKGSNYEKDSN